MPIGNNTLMNLQVECTNISELCVKGVNGVYYTIAYPSQIEDPNYFKRIVTLFSLCEHNQTSKKN